MARDEAFNFYYRDNLELMELAGAKVVPFSPVHDASLPDVDGIYIGGGYPELYARELSENAGHASGRWRRRMRKICPSTPSAAG